MPFGVNPVAIPPSLEPEEKRARLFYNEMTKSLREFECEDSDECFYLQDKTLDGESFAYHADSEQCLIVAKKKSDELPRSKISDREWPQFVEAMKKEVPEVLKSMRVLSMEESQQVLATKSDRIIPSRFHFRWKPVDEDGKIVHQAKCRWILIGIKDPDILELERSAPTPQAATINLTTNACACLRFEAYQGDIKSAFAQSKRIDRELYVSQPPEGIPGLQPGQLLQLETEIYGTVRGPCWWRETLVSEIMGLGYSPTSFDPCLFVLRSQAAEGDRRDRLQSAYSKILSRSLSGCHRPLVPTRMGPHTSKECKASSSSKLTTSMRAVQNDTGS